MAISIHFSCLGQPFTADHGVGGGADPQHREPRLVRNAVRGRSYRGCRAHSLWRRCGTCQSRRSRQFEGPAFTEFVIVSLTQFTEADLHDLPL